MDSVPALGRPRGGGPKLDCPVIVLLTREHRDELVAEAGRAGYRSLAAFLRERKLTREPMEARPQ